MEKMKSSSGAAEGMGELFVEQLKDVYWAEEELTKAGPKMSKNATSQELKEARDQHESVTEKQIERVEKVFQSMQSKQSAKKCEGMAGIIREGEEMMKETEQGMVRDAAIIAAAQK